jgi:hypothetical protein
MALSLYQILPQILADHVQVELTTDEVLLPGCTVLCRVFKAQSCRTGMTGPRRCKPFPIACVFVCRIMETEIVAVIVT